MRADFWYINGNDIILGILGPIAWISKCKFKTITGNCSEDIRCKLVVSSMYKLITCARDADGLSIRFYRD